MYFGTTIDEGRSREILDRFVERGGQLIDTANCYAFWAGDGVGDESEAVIGRWLTARGIRDQVLLATKVGSRPFVPGGTWPDDAEGLSPQVIRDGLAASLDRLGTDRIDLYLAHMDDPRTDLTDTLGAFADCVRQGMVTALGASNISTERLIASINVAEANRWPAYQVAQLRYSYLQPRSGVDFGPQRAIDDDLLVYAQSRPGMVLQGYSPLLSGAYTRADRQLAPEYQAADTPQRLATLRRISKGLGVTPNQVVLAWMLAGATPVRPIVGVSSIAQLDEAMDAAELALDSDTVKELAPPSRPRHVGGQHLGEDDHD